MEVLILVIVIAVIFYLGLHRPISDTADMAVEATQLLKHKQQLNSQKFYNSNKVNKKDALTAEINKRSFYSYADLDDDELEAELQKLTKTK
jgi:hypothetical protein